MKVNYCKFHTHSVENWKIYWQPKKISSNQLFSFYFSKNVTFTKFLSKKYDSKPQFPQHSVEITENLSHCFLAKKSKFFRETNAVNALFSKMAWIKPIFDQFRANLRNNGFSKSWRRGNFLLHIERFSIVHHSLQ